MTRSDCNNEGDQVFGSVYAGAYDSFYGQKDYDAECDLIEALWREYGDGKAASILDLGCGTGSHAIRLAQRGHTVVGVDRSEAMLTHARVKADDASERLTFHQGDIRDFSVNQQFDMVMVMFAVLGYQLENDDVLAALRAARQHLRPGGLLIFDVWYGPAVLTERPGQSVKVMPTDDGEILRIASGTLDVARHRCTVDYEIWHLQAGRLASRSTERHEMRYFFPQELKLFLDVSGFEMSRLGAFPKFNCEPDETTWNVCCVARPVGDQPTDGKSLFSSKAIEVGW
jgi:SAM-dependent methyltransferase